MDSLAAAIGPQRIKHCHSELFGAEGENGRGIAFLWQAIFIPEVIERNLMAARYARTKSGFLAAKAGSE